MWSLAQCAGHSVEGTCVCITNGCGHQDGCLGPRTCFADRLCLWVNDVAARRLNTQPCPPAQLQRRWFGEGRHQMVDVLVRWLSLHLLGG